MTRAYSCGEIWLNGAKTEVNATFTHTSIGPSSVSTCAAAAATWSYSAVSVGMASAVPPAFSTSFVAPARPSSPRARSATLAPRAPKARAAARPTPPLAPVMTTTCSLLIR